MGIEPTYSAWKAAALPLSYTRFRRLYDLLCEGFQGFRFSSFQQSASL